MIKIVVAIKVDCFASLEDTLVWFFCLPHLWLLKGTDLCWLNCGTGILNVKENFSKVFFLPGSDMSLEWIVGMGQFVAKRNKKTFRAKLSFNRHLSLIYGIASLPFQIISARVFICLQFLVNSMHRLLFFQSLHWLSDRGSCQDLLSCL